MKGCGGRVHEDCSVERAEGLPRPRGRPVPDGLSQPERLGKGREGQGGQSDGCNLQDADRQQGQEPSGCLGKHQVQPGVRQQCFVAKD